MSDSPHARTHRLLDLLVAGEDGAAEELVPLVYDELRDLAARLLEREQRAQSIQPTALVNEAYVRLAGAEARGFENKAKFAAVAARLMRQILVDHARRRNAQKRGGPRAAITVGDVAVPDRAFDVLAVDDLLEQLAGLHPRPARVLEMHVFANMTGEEIALVVGVSRRTIDKDLAIARGWLARELRPDEAE